MAGTSEPRAAPLARLRPASWLRGIAQTQTAYVVVAFAALIVVIWILAPVFVTPRNLLNISKNFSFIALMALGETLVIISGGIDLSVGSVCALSAIVTMMISSTTMRKALRAASSSRSLPTPCPPSCCSSKRATSPHSSMDTLFALHDDKPVQEIIYTGVDRVTKNNVGEFLK
jgi:ribose/xylose/arabinose/galactoside ABC-type transport system permease subunit